MKKIAILCSALMIIGSTAFVSAYGTTSTMPDYAPVKFTDDLNIQAVRQGSQINIKYESELSLNDQEFKYWKLMGSNDSNVAVYPEESAIKVWTDMGDTRHSEWKDGARYYRICMITKRYPSHPSYADGAHGRYCSQVVAVRATDGKYGDDIEDMNNDDGDYNDDRDENEDDDMHEGDDEYHSIKPVSSRKVVPQLLRDKIDTAVENMVVRLQTTHTDAEVATMLQSVVRQLIAIGKDKPAIAYVADYVAMRVQEQIDLLSLGDIMNLLN